MKVNCYGKRIKQLDVVADNAFLDDNGQVNWNLLINADEHGFDLNGCMENGKLIIPGLVLKVVPFSSFMQERFMNCSGKKC